MLVSNYIPNGDINACNSDTGQFVGTWKEASGEVIHNQLFFTAGPDNYATGPFGLIKLAE